MPLDLYNRLKFCGLLFSLAVSSIMVVNFILVYYAMVNKSRNAADTDSEKVLDLEVFGL